MSQEKVHGSVWIRPRPNEETDLRKHLSKSLKMNNIFFPFRSRVSSLFSIESPEISRSNASSHLRAVSIPTSFATTLHIFCATVE